MTNRASDCGGGAVIMLAVFPEPIPGRLLILLRQLAGMEQQEVAQRLGIDRRRWRAFEKGPLTPTPRLLRKLLVVVGFTDRDVPALLQLADVARRRRAGELPFEPQPVAWPSGPQDEASADIVKILAQFLRELGTLVASSAVEETVNAPATAEEPGSLARDPKPGGPQAGRPRRPSANERTPSRRS
jgi:transcriptional regulator with XRE-family HTH domain